MRYFFDTEFVESGPGHPIDLISIGIVAEDGREFYAESSDFDWDACNDWVQQNVLRKLMSRTQGGGGHRRADIGYGVRDFVGADTPEFWAYYADYDWVVLCQTFGRMIDLPSGWPMFCMDLRQVMAELGIHRSELPPEPVDAHNALIDARWCRDAYDAIASLSGPPQPPEVMT